jgi:DNA-binding response OmpR family regulator
MNLPEHQLRKPPRSVSERSPSFPEGPILCVDDNTAHLELHRAILEKSGYPVITCPDCRRSLDVFRTTVVRLVVVDYSMPQMNGAELARAMRIEKPNVPIVMLSGQAERPHDLGSAIDAYIVKGQNPLVLLHAVRSLMACQSAASFSQRTAV